MLYEVITNPVPVKTAAALMGKCLTDVRLPLAALQQTSLDKLKAIFRITSYNVCYTKLLRAYFSLSFSSCWQR